MDDDEHEPGPRPGEGFVEYMARRTGGILLWGGRQFWNLAKDITKDLLREIREELRQKDAK